MDEEETYEQRKARWKREAEEETRKAEEIARKAKAEMEALLAAPHDDIGDLEKVLTRQGHLLNDLFHKILRRNPTLTESGLEMGLRLQRECRQTIQGLARIRQFDCFGIKSPANKLKDAENARPLNGI